MRNKKKRSFFRKGLLSIVLAGAMAVSPLGTVTVRAEKTAKQMTEDYQKGLFDRYFEYLTGQYSYDTLTNSENYSHCLWADEIYDMTHAESVKIEDSKGKGFLENLKELSQKLDNEAVAELNTAFMWAGHALTDTELDVEAYIEYLSRIIAMHEKGFLETAMTQAEYTATVNVGKEIKNIFNTSWGLAKKSKKVKKLSDAVGKKVTVKVKDLFSKKGYDRTYKALEDTMEIVKGVKESETLKETKALKKAMEAELKNVEEVLVMSSYIQLHEERIEFLEAICEYAEDRNLKKLHKAADTLVDASNGRIMGLLMMDSKERAQNISEIWSRSTGTPSVKKCADEVMAYVSTAATAYLSKSTSEAAAFLLSGMKAIASNAVYVTAGFKIGVSLGKIFMGNEYEHYREMLIMNDIGDVLSEAVTDYDRQILDMRNEGKGFKKYYDKAYDVLHKEVAALEALCYVRLRGEYCATDYIKGKKGAPSDEELDQIFKDMAEWLNLYYKAIEAIFPEDRVVQVYVRRKYEHLDIGEFFVDSEIGMPTVSISGNEEAAEKINNSRKIKNVISAVHEYKEEMAEQAREWRDEGAQSSGYGSRSDLWFEDAYATKQALSMKMKGITFYETAVHPLSTIICCNFDTSTGEYLRLNDVLVEKDGSVQESKDQLKERLALALEYTQIPFRSAHEEIITEAFLEHESDDLRERHWYFSEYGFNVAFDVYQIAAYAAGTITITVPWSKLGGIIKEEYFCDEMLNSSSEGQPYLASLIDIKTDADFEEQEMTLIGDGAKSLYGGRTDKTTYDVKIKEDNKMIFYTNKMASDDLVWLEDDRGKELGEYAVYYLEKPSDSTQKTRHKRTFKLEHPFAD